MSGFTFRASNGEWYAVNADGEQSPSFRSERDAAQYLGTFRFSARRVPSDVCAVCGRYSDEAHHGRCVVSANL